ncbi:MAG: hypothetical protein AAFR67_02265 [Chloroflexota bacterium]
MIRFKRRNIVWLAALAIMTAIGLAGAASLTANVIAVQFMLIAVFALATVASTVEIGRERETLIDALRRAPIRNRVSPDAREALDRAKGRGGYENADLMMLDVGLIAVQSSIEGMAMRRTRSISKDDDGVRPFIALNVEPSEAERHATIRFEIYNQFGEEKFVHEMRAYLREGEMNIMTDHHLPLAGNRDITGAGDWDLRVYVDGNLLGMHNFNLSPSMTERQRRLAAEQDVDMGVYNIVDEVEQEVTPRLQDLLQSQRDNQQNGNDSRLNDSDVRSDTASDTGVTRRRRSRTTTRRRR